MTTVTQLYTSDSLAARVAARVRGLSGERGLKQKDIARLLQLSPGQVSGRLTGRIPFKLDELDVLAQYFGVDPIELLPRRPAQPTAETRTAQDIDAAMYRAVMADKLPELDLNQQPCGDPRPLVAGGLYQGPYEGVPRRHLVLVPPRIDRTADEGDATRPIIPRPFRLKIICAAYRSAS